MNAAEHIAALEAASNPAPKGAGTSASTADCAFCVPTGAAVFRCYCDADCGHEQCVHRTDRPGDWLWNPRALAPIPVFAVHV